MASRQTSDRVGESFQGLLLRHRGRTGLTQRELAARTGVSKRTLQDWEAGVSYPGVERLQALIAAFLSSGGQAAGHETVEAQELWSAALREAPRLHTPFDPTWFNALLVQVTNSAGPGSPACGSRAGSSAAPRLGRRAGRRRVPGPHPRVGDDQPVGD